MDYTTKKKKDEEIMTADDYRQSLLNSQGYEAAKLKGDTSGMDAYHRANESLRAKYDYSGGEDGSEYISSSSGGMLKRGTALAEKSAGATYTYGKPAPTYGADYDSRIERLTDRYMKRVPFNYNYLEDPSYQQYAEAYTRGGRRAMEDTYGQVAQRSGGLASSYAATASQQAYDRYMQALADKVPELRQQAYQRYRDEGDDLLQQIALLRGLDSTAYERYRTALGQYNADRSFDYGAWSNANSRASALADSYLALGRWQADRDRQLANDALAAEQWSKSYDRQLANDALAAEQWSKSYDRQLANDALAAEQWSKTFDQSERKLAASSGKYANFGNGYNDEGGNDTIDLDMLYKDVIAFRDFDLGNRKTDEEIFDYLNNYLPHTEAGKLAFETIVKRLGKYRSYQEWLSTDDGTATSSGIVGGSTKNPTPHVM